MSRVWNKNKAEAGAMTTAKNAVFISYNLKIVV